MLKVLHHMCVLWCVSLLLVRASTHSKEYPTVHHLGDSVTSQQATQDLFSDLDINGNGRISETELFEVREGLISSSFLASNESVSSWV